jgi:hypothetical protein
MERKKKTHIFKIRLTEDEAKAFETKAIGHQSVSAMVRMAVEQYNNAVTLGKFDALMEMTGLYKKYQQELGWLGGNFNQAMKRANQLAIGNQLAPDFFEKILFPQVKPIMRMLQSIKREQEDIAKKLVKL